MLQMLRGFKRSGPLAQRAENAVRAQPQLVLYEYDASPWCKRVREHLSYLGLDYEVRPCPRSSLFKQGSASPESRFRNEAKEKYGAMYQYPFLVDETSNLQLQDSTLIVQHLWRNYGKDVTDEDQAVESRWHRADKVKVAIPRSVFSEYTDVPRLLFSAAKKILTPAKGAVMTPSIDASELPGTIVLHGNETCEKTAKVRETLCELQLPYRMVIQHEQPEVLPRLTIDGEELGRPGFPRSQSILLKYRFTIGETKHSQFGSSQFGCTGVFANQKYITFLHEGLAMTALFGGVTALLLA